MPACRGPQTLSSGSDSLPAGHALAGSRSRRSCTSRPPVASRSGPSASRRTRAGPPSCERTMASSGYGLDSRRHGPRGRHCSPIRSASASRLRPSCRGSADPARERWRAEAALAEAQGRLAQAERDRATLQAIYDGGCGVCAGVSVASCSSATTKHPEWDRIYGNPGRGTVGSFRGCIRELGDRSRGRHAGGRARGPGSRAHTPLRQA